MDLKDYQLRARDAVALFLETALTRPHAAAYAAACEVGLPGPFASRYVPPAGLPDVPYCCVRLPTGGGKTLLASHAVGIAQRTYLQRRHPLVLWLAHRDIIAAQTLDALRTPGHPYRRALLDPFGGAGRVLAMDERRQVRRQDFESGPVIVVGTVQSFRVSNKDGRKVYAADEELETHFRDLPPGHGLEMRGGKPVPSFAQLCALRRPLAILDEAHNFMSELSADTLARLRPAAILEFTATPKPRSNVIANASAAELKTEHMIKLPIHLSAHDGWENAVNCAVQQRARLAEIAAGDPGRVRPIALYQAQPQNAGAVATWERVRSQLIDVERVPAERIRVATGEQRGLDGVNLFDPACTVEHVITVDALKEGWDCSFAYVFCSLASIRAPGAVEQLLGRVLRMPFATRRPSEELNRAYAHVSEPSFLRAAEGLRDRLVAMGFDQASAAEAIVEQPSNGALALGGGGMGAPLVLTVAERPDVSAWPAEAAAAVTIVQAGDGVRVTVAGDTDADVVRDIARRLRAPAVAAEIFLARRSEGASPAARGASFSVPRLGVEIDGQRELVYPETLVDLSGWSLGGADTSLPGFSVSETADVVAFDLEGDRVVFQRLDEALELALDDATDWDAAALSRFIDRGTRQPYISQPVHLEWCRRVIERLLRERGFGLAALVRGKYALRRAMADRVRALHRGGSVRGLQMLLDGAARALVLGENAFRFDRDTPYEARNRYEGAFRFRKHFYAAVGDLKSGGEEFAAACAIDGLEQVEHWVRNVDRSAGAYWLPTSTDRFYPDFVARLLDGRLLVAEYKGGFSVDADNREKRNVGALLAESSGGKIVFSWLEAERSGLNLRGQLLADVAGR